MLNDFFNFADYTTIAFNGNITNIDLVVTEHGFNGSIPICVPGSSNKIVNIDNVTTYIACFGNQFYDKDHRAKFLIPGLALHDIGMYVPQFDVNNFNTTSPIICNYNEESQIIRFLLFCETYAENLNLPKLDVYLYGKSTFDTICTFFNGRNKINVTKAKLQSHPEYLSFVKDSNIITGIRGDVDSTIGEMLGAKKIIVFSTRYNGEVPYKEILMQHYFLRLYNHTSDTKWKNFIIMYNSLTHFISEYKYESKWTHDVIQNFVDASLTNYKKYTLVFEHNGIGMQNTSFSLQNIALNMINWITIQQKYSFLQSAIDNIMSTPNFTNNVIKYADKIIQKKCLT